MSWVLANGKGNNLEIMSYKKVQKCNRKKGNLNKTNLNVFNRRRQSKIAQASQIESADSQLSPA